MKFRHGRGETSEKEDREYKIRSHSFVGLGNHLLLICVCFYTVTLLRFIEFKITAILISKSISKAMVPNTTDTLVTHLTVRRQQAGSKAGSTFTIKRGVEYMNGVRVCGVCLYYWYLSM